MQIGKPLPIKTGVHKMRTAVLADKLLERGHKVLWWVNAFEHILKKPGEDRPGREGSRVSIIEAIFMVTTS